MSQGRMTSQNVVITGAAGGIGAALVRKFGEAGATVWALDLDEAGLAARREECSRFGWPIETRVADVRDQAALSRIASEAAATGPLTVWINNAGIAGIGGLLETPAADYDRVLAVNLGGVIHGTRAALPLMEAGGRGTIVNVASMAGHLPAPLMSAYCASKHGVVGFTRSLRAELVLRASPIRTVLVCPGFVDTAIIKKGQAMGFPTWLGFMLSTPEEVSGSVFGAVRSGTEEIYPTLNAKVLRAMYRLMPATTVRTARMLLAKSWKDALLNRFEA